PATSGGTVIYVAASNTWIAGGGLFRGSYQDEASWVKLADDSILTIDPFGSQSERYIPSLNRWIDDATVPIALYDSFGFELGAAFLLPAGRAFFLGATGNTALYTPSGNTNMGVWQAGPVIPNAQGTPDAPAAMMVNGKILCAVSPVPTSANHFPSPSSVYEFEPVAIAFTQVSGPTGSTYPGATYVMRMLDLPDGTVLLATSGSQLYVYQPGGLPLAAGQPAVSNITQNADQSFHITGTLLNGISEGAAYGDDVQMDSNYPLVRMIDGAGVVYYARTYGWTSTSVMASNRLVSSEFTLPANLPATNFSLVVIANGNSSAPASFSTAASVPVMVTQPKNQAAVVGTSVTFTVAAAGTPLQYLWQHNGIPIAGATASSYTTNNVQIINSGDVFGCLVSNFNGPTQSSNAVLTVVPGFPPGITAQPTNQSVLVGGLATVSVTATSTAAISYFWQRNGSVIAGATSSTYSTNNVQLSDSGTFFRCVVSNIFGSTLSSNAVLTVVTGPSNDLCSTAFVVTTNNYANA
ncbi:MAG TPA: immunoglobulin domain-containing protein, partial [Candidatus Saccharimonadales bacterium]|nr:immunoglobulin domain-containing protein [Candidatus Saccharimonadales bacterium]